VLFVVTEFRWWHRARSWAYPVQLGLEEGLAAEGVSRLTVPTPWLPRVRELCGTRPFDQIWIELVHQERLDEGLLAWLADRAPVRVGFVPESLEYDAAACAQWPQYRTRKAEVMRRLALMTHAVMVDEKDVDDVSARGGPPALWWPQAVPERFMRDVSASALSGPAVFAGALYGQRQPFLDDPSVRELVSMLASPEEATLYPRAFERLQMIAGGWVNRALPCPRPALSAYVFVLRRLRRRIFTRWLGTLRRGGAIVNLPHLVGAYPGRVVEAMAAARAVVAWDVPDRPRNRALFEDGREILLFRTPDELGEAVRRLRDDPACAEALVRNASRKVRRLHTAERRVRDILAWIDTGAEPSLA
jgi:hypothetical protein